MTRVDQSEPGALLNVLITEDRPQPAEHWTRQLPRLLAPHGVNAFYASTARQAIDLVEAEQIHAAIVDLGTPVGDVSDLRRRGIRISVGDGCFWLLEFMRRLPHHPPVVAVNSPALSPRQINQLLRESLRMGVFSVVNKPVELELVLDVFRRLVEARYRQSWMRPNDASSRQPPTNG